MGLKRVACVFSIFVIFSILAIWELHRQASIKLDVYIRNIKKSNDAPHDITDTATSSSSFTVDILSVSSVNQMDLLHAQQTTFATHKSVRNFFNATETDDADPFCHGNITFQHVDSVSKFCRKRHNRMSPVLRYLSGQYARTPWLGKKKNPTGWLCAQVRPYSGLMKTQLHYQQTGQELPNYLLIFDDDTYYNMEKFQMNFASFDSSIEKVYAGCLVRAPLHMTNFTFPFGGFGSILSKGALVRLFKRHLCPGLGGSKDIVKDFASMYNKESFLTGDSSADFCRRLKEDNVGELKYFTNGMNLVELMYKYSNTDKYRDVNRWSRDSQFCMHSVRIMQSSLQNYGLISSNQMCISHPPLLLWLICHKGLGTWLLCQLLQRVHSCGRAKVQECTARPI